MKTLLNKIKISRRYQSQHQSNFPQELVSYVPNHLIWTDTGAQTSGTDLKTLSYSYKSPWEVLCLRLQNHHLELGTETIQKPVKHKRKLTTYFHVFIYIFFIWLVTQVSNPIALFGTQKPVAAHIQVLQLFRRGNDWRGARVKQTMVIYTPLKCLVRFWGLSNKKLYQNTDCRSLLMQDFQHIYERRQRRTTPYYTILFMNEPLGKCPAKNTIKM